jgi:hypothetical protein
VISGALAIKEVRSARIEKLEMLFYLEVLFVTINEVRDTCPRRSCLYMPRGPILKHPGISTSIAPNYSFFEFNRIQQ